VSLRVVAIAGSVREQSFNKQLLALAVAGLQQRGVEVDLPFAGKLAMHMGATKGRGGTLLAQKDLRHLLSMGFRMWVMPGVNVIVSLAEQAFDEQGKLKDAALVKQLDSSLDAFAAELSARAKR